MIVSAFASFRERESLKLNHTLDAVFTGFRLSLSPEPSLRLSAPAERVGPL